MSDVTKKPLNSTPSGKGMSGLGKVLIAVYIVLAIAATSRSLYQILSKFSEAPLPYALSAVSGVVYILATIALIKRGSAIWRLVAWVALSFEMLGVLIVGTLSLTMQAVFQHPSVWSVYGQGYGFIPLVLPVLGLVWLYREQKR